MKDTAKYVKIIEWSEEDQCYVGSPPGLMYGGCNGIDEKIVLAELCELVGETIELYSNDGRPLPPPTSGRDLATIMQNIACTTDFPGTHCNWSSTLPSLLFALGCPKYILFCRDLAHYEEAGGPHGWLR